MWLVVGLGNPGRKYERNRHNVGFRVIDELARRHNLGAFRQKFGGEVATGALGRESVMLLKPMEYMNHSGYAVQRAAQFRQVPAERILVIHDDIDLDFGRLRLKAGGGHGGHNGLRSLQQQLGDAGFVRVRVGVGKPPGPPGAGRDRADERDRRVASYVLSDFPGELSGDVEAVVDCAADAAEAVLERGLRPAMNDFNGKDVLAPPGGGSPASAAPK